ncbi:MAG: ATP-dependent DNA helicase [Pseudomonadota bacterium]
MKLNENQLKAVTHVNGPLLIIAGAGTGKTSAIAYRIANLIENEGINPANILALTFSNKAAEEMRERVEGLLNSSHDNIWISTFHSFCAEVLRENALELGLSPFFKLITEAEQLSMMVENIDRLDLKYYEIKGNPHALMKQFLDVISRAKDEMITASDYSQFAEMLNLDKKKKIDALKVSEVAGVYSVYQKLLMEHDLLDFGDLILYTIHGLLEKPYLLDQYQQRFKYILVDEFQDTNFAQSQLLDVLSASHRNICVVGDDDQSIYRFRGASIKNIQDFKIRYPDAAIITLDENYRSPQKILDASHSLISNNFSRLDKKLKAATDKNLYNINPIEHLSFNDDTEQADYLAWEIRNLLAKDETLNLSDIAVLMRSIKTQSKPVVNALERTGIPYNLIGGSGFFERKEIRDILSWMKTIDNPFDTENLIRAIHNSPFNIASIDVCRISNWGKSNSGINLFDALNDVGSVTNLDNEVIEEVHSFLRLLQDLTDQKEDLTAGEMVRQIIDKIGYRERLFQTGTREYMIGLINLQKLENMAEDYSSIEGYSNLRSFLSYLTYLILSSEKTPDLPLFDAVKVMTIHQAKGLEFRVVFMTDLVQSRFPGRRRSLTIDLPDELLKEELPDASSRELQLNEERRLFYVGMTRAKEKLRLFHVKRYRKEQTETKPSQFIVEAMGETPELEHKVIKNNILNKNLPSEFNLAKSIMDISNEIKFSEAEKIDFKTLLKEGLRSHIEFLKVQLLNAKDTNQFERKLKLINQSINDLLGKDGSNDLLNQSIDDKLRSIILSKEEKSTRLASKELASYLEFLPIVDGGLDIAFSALDTYDKCPLQFKYSFIYKIPLKPTINIKVGSLLHRVLEYFHKNYTRKGATVKDLLRLFEDAWKMDRLPDSIQWRQFKERARTGLINYFENFKEDKNEPKYFERSFNLKVGKHRIKGRVDRVDITSTGGYELIDYKTGKTWAQREVDRDLQLSVYSLGATEAWNIKPEKASYYFLIENKRLSISHQDEQLEKAREKILELAEGILAENFEPKPDYQNCRYCDYQTLCGVGETV